MAAYTPTTLAKTLSISVPYASQIISRQRPLPRDLAVRLYRLTGEKLGPLEGATEHQIESLEAIPASGDWPAKAA